MMWQGDEIHRNGEESNSSLSAGQLTSMASRRSSMGNHNGRGRGESGRIGSLIASTFSKIQDSLRDETAAVATSDKERQVDDNNTFMGQKWKEAEDYNHEKGRRERLTARSMSMSHASTVVVAKADEWASPPCSPPHLHQSDQEMQHQNGGQHFVHKSYSHAVLRESSRSQRRRRSTIQHITLPSIEAPDGMEGQEYEVDTAGGPRDAGSSSTAGSWKTRGLHRRSSSGGVDKWHRNNSMNLMNLKSVSHDEIEVDAAGSYTYHNSSLTSSASPNASARRGWGMSGGGGGSSGGTASGAGSSILRRSGSFGDMTQELTRRWEATQNSLDDEINQSGHASADDADGLLLRGGLELGKMNPGESKQHHQPRRGKRPAAARRNSMF